MHQLPTAPPRQRPVGELLRQWRERRRLSQLDLALQAEISTRHLSFVETGRSRPSRDMLLRLAEQLELPLRERNHLLLAGGYAPVYGQTALDTPQMAGVRAALRQVLAGHEPYPAVVVDRGWNLVDANASVALFIGQADPALLAPPTNVLRVSLHPDGMAPQIVNLGEWRAHLLGRLRRQIALTADPELVELHQELRAYPCDQPEPEIEVPGPGDMVVPLRVRHGGRQLSFLSIMATFGTPLDVIVAELAIESFFPADAETGRLLRDAWPATPGRGRRSRDGALTRTRLGAVVGPCTGAAAASSPSSRPRAAPPGITRRWRGRLRTSRRRCGSFAAAACSSTSTTFLVSGRPMG